MEISEQVASVRARMADACDRAGRAPNDVRLLAVTKYVDTDRILSAVRAGITEVGENHAQEFKEKLTFFEQCGVRPHFIGQLQSNKVKYICGRAATVQSVDRMSLAEPLNRYALSHGAVQDVLIQINIGDEAQKGGLPAAELDPFLDRLAELSALRVCGLMCVPPALTGEQVRPYFRQMRLLFEAMQQKHRTLPLSVLSMGMSHDFETAIEEGATMVRVGSAIFGSRPRI